MTWEAVPIGESALVIRFGESIDLDLNRRALATDAAVQHAAIPGVLETAPALASLLVRYDPDVVDARSLEERVGELVVDDWATTQREVVQVPVRYGGPDGPDIERVAALRDCSVAQVVADHTALDISVLMIGFAPGFAYCGLADSSWDLPRAESITAEVPPGSILVAVRQTAIAATAVPTGWHCIGRTSLALFDPTQDPPSALSPGTRLRFTVDTAP